MMRRVWHLAWETLRRYFVAGLLVFAPIGVTVWAIAWIIQRLDNLFLPHILRLAFPDLEQAPRLPVVGALFTLVVIILIGVAARHLFGAELVRVWERLLRRVPVARSIYGAVKQLLEAMFSARAREHFRRVVMIEYPRKGIYALAFTTGPARGLLQDVTEDRMINCFLPTTPNPTSGFYLLVPEQDVIEVALTVEDAFKLVMSAGLVSPGDRPGEDEPSKPRLGAAAPEPRPPR
ncbi:MAG: DUF502 domain-containing protein [Deltaproteobacteria bacterium]|nr:MAG: DUF502 domain-containing protein [Deltaproteobacteria bacterium]